MAVTFEAGSGGTNSHWSGDYTITLGASPTAGQLIVLLTTAVSGTNTPSGFTLLCSEVVNPGGSPTTTFSAYAKESDGTEGANFAIDGVVTEQGEGVGFLLNDVGDLTGFSQWDTSFQLSTTGVAPSVSVADDDSYLIAAFWFGSNHSESPSRGTIVFDAPNDRFTIVGDPVNSGASGTTTLTNAFSQSGNATLVFPPVVSSGNSGAITTDAATVSGSSILEIEATGSVTTEAATVAGQGVLEISGAGAITTDDATAAGSGSLAIEGAGVVTTDAAQVSGIGGAYNTGQGAVTTDDATTAAVGSLAIQGAGAFTTAAATVAGAGSEQNTGQGNVTTEAATVAGSASLGIQGAGAFTTAAATVAGQATLSITGQGAVTLDDATISGGNPLPFDNEIVFLNWTWAEGNGITWTFEEGSNPKWTWAQVGPNPDSVWDETFAQEFGS